MTSHKSSVKRSGSEALRKEGNEIYSQVASGCYGPCLLRHKLGRAHQLYEAALEAASFNDKSERASCYKNLGALNWLWGKSEWEIYMKEERGNEALIAICSAKQHISKSLEFHLLALQFGECGSKPKTWVKQAEDSVTKMVEWVREQLSIYNICFEPILVALCGLMDNIGSNSSQKKKNVATLILNTSVDFIFKQGIKSFSSDKESGFKHCLNAMKDCYLPLNKAEAVVYSTNDKMLIKEFEGLKEQVLLHQCICESVQARCQGDALLEKALFEEESVGMELVWDAIDWFRHSIKLSKGKDLENEAMALSRIGRVYSSVLKLEKEAHRYHFESTRIALAIMSPHIADSEWYKYSSSKVHEHQKNTAEQEKTEHERRHERDSKRVQEPIEVIKKEGGKSAESFLQFIYRVHKHPDPKKGLMGSIGTPDNVKAALKKAIVAYHPDNNCQYDRDWQVLCEEITKILNCKYENYK